MDSMRSGGAMAEGSIEPAGLMNIISFNPVQQQDENAIDGIENIIEEEALAQPVGRISIITFNPVQQQNGIVFEEEPSVEPADWNNIIIFNPVQEQEENVTDDFANIIEGEALPEESPGTPSTPRLSTLEAIEAELNSYDPLQDWPYATEVFAYLRLRERKFIVDDYMSFQTELTPWKRTLFISWMVTLHHGFGTFRDTFSLAVKIVDLFLCNYVVEESELQLLGATAIYVACKFEEKDTLSIEGLLGMCDATYLADDIRRMEVMIVTDIDFDLGIPIGFRFLRRFALSSEVPVPTWTLACYILELGLMDYTTIKQSDSKLAAAALWIALRMSGEPGQLDGYTWNATLVFNSGYLLPEFAVLVAILNGVLHCGNWSAVRDVHDLYSTPLLHEVAKMEPLTTEELFRDNPELYEDGWW